MNPFTFRPQHRLSLAVITLSAFGFAGIAAQAASKPSAPASHPAPAAHASAPAASHPSGGGAAASHSTGASTAGHTGTGATTTHTGPTTSSPHTTTTTGGTHPTTTTSGTHATTTTSGTHPTTTGGGTHPGTGTTGGGTHVGTTAQTKSTNAHVGTSATGHIAPASSHTTQTKNGAVTKRANGKVSDVHDTKHNMDVHHNLNGSKRVETKRADGSRVVAERGRAGYIERGYHYNGHDYARRSYYYHGHEYNRYYRGYYYGGVYMNVYAPGFYYGPGFYGWAYNPWYSPISYGWGWGGNPWYGYYGFYFNPYPVYAGPAFWLTDYLVSTELAAAYAAQQEAHTEAVAAAAAAGAPLLSEAIKAQIADEVKAQIALENAESQQNAAGQEPDPASSGISRLLTDGKSHVFVAGTALDVVDASGTECAISDGDALQLTTDPPANATDASLTVLSSKGGQECQRAATVTVAVADLQEMQNHMRETIDQGLQELQTKQGKGGLPAAPASAQAPPTETAMAKAAPPPEPNGAADVNQQLQVADQVDADANASSPIGGVASNNAPSQAPPVSIGVGQSIDQVTAALGQPLTVIDLGAKKIYKYKDMKVTFKAGKVSDVE